MTDKLKRCPFCGSEYVAYKITHTGVHRVGCNDCGASTNYYLTEAEAIAAWNQRAGGKKKARIAELEAQLAEAKQDINLAWLAQNATATDMSKWKARAENLEAPLPKWIPVTSETMPEDDVEVVGLHNGRDYWNLRIATYLAEINCWTEDSRVLAEGTITHYMSLPELPEEE